mmetsp:Transcript_29104/g.61917  ORF Transcript_29104/g.61917 Transcript_29104/m.61917 type:complete len:281 (-) Transcript_29104:41-883(-)
MATLSFCCTISILGSKFIASPLRSASSSSSSSSTSTSASVASASGAASVGVATSSSVFASATSSVFVSSSTTASSTTASSTAATSTTSSTLGATSIASTSAEDTLMFSAKSFDVDATLASSTLGASSITSTSAEDTLMFSRESFDADATLMLSLLSMTTLAEGGSIPSTTGGSIPTETAVGATDLLVPWLSKVCAPVIADCTDSTTDMVGSRKAFCALLLRRDDLPIFLMEMFFREFSSLTMFALLFIISWKRMRMDCQLLELVAEVMIGLMRVKDYGTG